MTPTVLHPGDSVFGYIRVSGDEQADRGLPVAGQREAIERHCDEHQLHLAGIFIDEARPGGSDNRPAFREMMHLAQTDRPPVRAILLWSWSRFARQQDDAHYWKAALRRKGVEVIPIDGSMPSVPGFEYVLESLIHWRDEQRRFEIGEDARRGQQTLARMGFVPSGAPPPHGYRVEFIEQVIEGRQRRLRRWVPDPETWPLVRRAWAMRLAGKTYRQIAAATGLYTSTDSWQKFYANSIYKGELRYGATVISVEPVVTEEEWDTVNRARKTARTTGAKGGRNKAVRPYLLSGLIRCARCESAMVGKRRPPQRRRDGSYSPAVYSYRCLRRIDHHACDMPTIRADAIEEAVVAALFEQVLTPENVAAQWQAYLGSRTTGDDGQAERIDSARASVARLEASVASLLDAIEVGGDAVPALVTRLNERNEALQAARANLARLEQSVDAVLPQPDPEPFLRRLRETMAMADRVAIRDLLATVIVAVYVDIDTFRIVYRPPFPDPSTDAADDSGRPGTSSGVAIGRAPPKEASMVLIGLDVGTTKLAALALDADTGETVSVVSTPNAARRDAIVASLVRAELDVAQLQS
ncbi:MAG: recombinase family protein, partial [Chloroflexi bacterium]|nr:recombinase family protein [Chloroflexota bacterium]